VLAEDFVEIVSLSPASFGLDSSLFDDDEVEGGRAGFSRPLRRFRNLRTLTSDKKFFARLAAPQMGGVELLLSSLCVDPKSVTSMEVFSGVSSVPGKETGSNAEYLTPESLNEAYDDRCMGREKALPIRSSGLPR
jgi:hypothetical protein